MTLSIGRKRLGLSFFSLLFRKIAGIKTKREIPLNQKGRLAVRSIGRIPVRERKRESE